MCSGLGPCPNCTMHTVVHNMMMQCYKCRVSHELQWHIACEDLPFQYQLFAVCTGQGTPKHCTDFIVLYDVCVCV